jgi:hypothetical protein
LPAPTFGTRYVFIIIRTLADPEKPDDVKAANGLQNAIKVECRGGGADPSRERAPLASGALGLYLVR